MTERIKFSNQEVTLRLDYFAMIIVGLVASIWFNKGWVSMVVIVCYVMLDIGLQEFIKRQNAQNEKEEKKK